MNEEEKKAIEYLKDLRFEKQAFSISKDDFEEVKQIETILKLIEKQQKEIEELRQWKYTIDTYEDLDKLKELDLIKIKGKEYISKDKIREYKEAYKQKREQEIKELGMSMLGSAIDILEKLLGE